jgi:hypothetical protein
MDMQTKDPKTTSVLYLLALAVTLTFYLLVR